MKKKSKSKAVAKRPSASAVKNSVNKLTAHVTKHEFSGPIPHPEILNGYNEIVPGAAERILILAEEDAKHQREIERDALNFAAEEIKRGQWFGLTIGVLAFVASILALALGSEKAAIALGGTTVVGLVTVFVVGRVKQPK